MPPNLGGFFMVRSYYPSECHADYFDFGRIEALKPAISACGLSSLSQYPMLGFHKQIDNRIKLLEEILSFRMQGVGFDNGDMYVFGHKAASYVRDGFVSVTASLIAFVISSVRRFLSASENSAGNFLVGSRNGFAATMPSHWPGNLSSTTLDGISPSFSPWRITSVFCSSTRGIWRNREI